MPKFVELDKDARMELGTHITDGWRDDNQDREEWLHDLPKWVKSYQARVEEKNQPWEGASNLHVPVTATVVDAIHPRFMAAVLRPTPIVSFRPQEPGDEALATRREVFLDWAAREEVNLFPVLDRTILGLLINGIQFVKVTWDLRTRSLRDKHVFPRETDIQSAIQTILQGEAQFIEAVNRVSDLEHEVIVKGRKVKIEVETNESKLIVWTEREEVVKDAPTVTLIDPEDIAVPSDASYDLNEADHIYHRFYLTHDQLKREVKKGVFEATKEDLQELKDSLSSTSVEPDDNTYDVKLHRDDITGTEMTQRAGGPEKIELIDAYLRWDINDDGYDEEVIVTLPRHKPDMILRCVRLEEVFRHGMRPFVMFYLFPVANTIWSIGVPQILEGLQQEFNVIHNQRVDAGTIGNMPFTWYVPAAGFNPEKQPLEPGFAIPVDSIDHVKMHTPANYTAWSEREEAILWGLLERRTKVSDLTLGRVGDTQGAARTATGVQALSAQQATGFDILIRRVQEGVKQLLQQILALYRQYMPPMKEVRILGKTDDPETVVSRDDLRGHMDMIFTGNSLSTDREVERNTMTFLAQSALNPQVLGFLLQLQVTTPQGIAEWYRHLLSVFDVPRLERMIQVPAMPDLQTPETVISRTLAGERLVPKQGEDHAAIVQKITELLQRPDAAAGIPPEAQVLLAEQIQKRQDMLRQEMIAQQLAQILSQAQAQPAGQIPQVGGVGGAPIPLPQQPGGLVFGR